MTKVIHIKDAPTGWQLDEEYVYIGRAKGSLSGKWGNPFILTFEADRVKILRLYINYIQVKFNEALGNEFKDSIKQLKDKILVCYCKPKLCHGDILALLADMG